MIFKWFLFHSVWQVLIWKRDDNKQNVKLNQTPVINKNLIDQRKPTSYWSSFQSLLCKKAFHEKQHLGVTSTLCIPATSFEGDKLQISSLKGQTYIILSKLKLPVTPIKKQK